jgi:hypothetical protein
LCAVLKILDNKYYSGDNNFLVNVWYTYHAVTKSAQYKQLTTPSPANEYIKKQLYPEITELHALPRIEGRGSITDYLKRSLGLLFTKSKNAATYFYYYNSRNIKDMAALGIVTSGLWMIANMVNQYTSPPMPSTVTMPVGEGRLVGIIGSGIPVSFSSK